MILDVIGIIIIIGSFIRGYRKGLIVAAFSIVAVILGIICAMRLSHVFAAWMLEKGWVSSGWAQLVSYIVLFMGVAWLVRMGGKLLEQTVKALFLGLFNNLAGGLVYAFIGVIVWSSCLWLGNQVHMFSPETLASSKTFSLLQPVAPWLFDNLGVILPFAKGMFAEMQQFFEQVNRQLPTHVGIN